MAAASPTRFAGLYGGDYYDQARLETIVLVEDRASIAKLILGPWRAVDNDRV
jgi:hypothetical protein